MKLDIQLFADTLKGTVYGGKVTNGKNANMRACVDWEAKAGTSEQNYSTLTLKLYGQRQDQLSEPTSGWYWKGTVIVKDVTGKEHKPISFTSMGKSVAIKNNEWTHFKTATITVPHNNDGTGTATIYLSLEGPQGCSFAGRVSSGSGTITLDTIPRASDFKIKNTSGTEITSGVLGQDIVFNIDSKSDNFHHKAGMLYESLTTPGIFLSETLIEKIDKKVTTATLKLSDDIFLPLLPNKSKTFAMYIKTLNDADEQIGDAPSINFTVSVPDSYKPSLSIGEVSDVNANAPINNGVFVKGKSTLKIPVTFTSHDEHTELKSYTVTINDEKYTGIISETFTGNLSGTSVTKEFTCSKALSAAGLVYITASVTDNRNNTNSVTHAYTVHDYFAPSIKASSILRANDQGIADDEGTRLIYSFTADIKQIGNNKPRFTVSFRVNDGVSEWKTLYTNTTDYSVALSNVLDNSDKPFSTEKEYLVKFRAQDSYNESVELTYKLDTGFDIMNVNMEGTAVAFGKKSTAYGKEKKFESALPMIFDKTLRVATFQDLRVCESFESTGSRWQRICIIKRTKHVQGSFAFFRLHMGTGNNGRSDQNAFIDLTLQQGWTGEANGGLYGGNYILHPVATEYTLSSAKVKVRAINISTYEIWFYTAFPFCKVSYSYDADDMTIIEHDGQSFSTSEPTGTFCNVTGVNEVLAAYPIGAIYMSKSATNPKDLFGGTWTAIKDRVVIGAGNLYNAGDEGGSKDAVVVSHTHYVNLTAASAGAHTHKIRCDQDAQYTSSGTRSWSVHKAETGAGNTVGITDSKGAHTHAVQGDANWSGVSGTNANLPPYKAYYIWERTA
jgi:hypothetical protein